MAIRFTKSGIESTSDDDDVLGSLDVPSAQDVKIHADLPSLQVDLQAKLANLKTALEVEAPDIANYLRHIHASLMKNPEVVYLLKPEELGNFTKAAMKVRNITIVEKAVAAPKARATKALTKSMADFNPEDI